MVDRRLRGVQCSALWEVRGEENNVVSMTIILRPGADPAASLCALAQLAQAGRCMGTRLSPVACVCAAPLLQP